MDLRRELWSALRAAGTDVEPPPPSALVTAAAAVLGVAGAGLTLTERDLRLPIGASSPEVVTAEQLQATLGDGPCLHAAATGAVQSLGESDLRSGWPIYHDELTRRTTFRAVTAVPLRLDGRVFAALNLYSDEPEPPALPGSTTLLNELADLVASALAGVVEDADQLVPDSGSDRPFLLDTDDARRLHRRVDVWIAVGVVMEASDLDDRDALAILRSAAFGRGTSIDALADDLVAHRVGVSDVLRDRRDR